MSEHVYVHLEGLHNPIPDDLHNLTNVSQTRNFINHCHSQFASTLAENDRLFDMIRANEGALAALSNRVLYLKSYISPIRHLPVEVLSEIFFLVIETVLDKPLSQYRHDRDALVEDRILHMKARTSLSLVCKHWNTTIENTPKLWSRIVAKPSTTTPVLSLTRLWKPLQKAGRYPLAITVDLTNIQTGYSLICQAFYDLVKHSHWRSLELFKIPPTSEILAPFMNHDLSRTSSFSIVPTWYWYSNPRPFEMPDTFSNCPQLRDMTVPWYFLEPNHPIFKRWQTYA